METDKKVEEYLERATAIRKKLPHVFVTDDVEIAKMIQLEEHQQEFIDLNKSKL